MRIVVIAVFSVIFVAIGYHLYGANTERLALKNSYSAILAEYEALKLDTEKLREDIEYYLNPHNLEKELRARFNYRAPNEKTIIVVPENSE